MSKPSARSTLYRLIEAGQLAHKALLVPLLERGLEPGDDAVLFVLGRAGTTEAELAAELGLEGEALERRLARLSERELIARQAVGPQLQPGLALTERGERMKSVLAGNWEELENALLGELKKKQRKRLGAVLQRFVELLRI
jgi:DNA-binding MarR family transcriptional regulator